MIPEALSAVLDGSELPGSLSKDVPVNLIVFVLDSHQETVSRPHTTLLVRSSCYSLRRRGHSQRARPVASSGQNLSTTPSGGKPCSTLDIRLVNCTIIFIITIFPFLFTTRHMYRLFILPFQLSTSLSLSMSISIYRCLYLVTYAALYILLPCCAINPINPQSLLKQTKQIWNSPGPGSRADRRGGRSICRPSQCCELN